MKKAIFALALLAIIGTSCRTVTVQQAANGKAKCGKRLK